MASKTAKKKKKELATGISSIPAGILALIGGMESEPKYLMFAGLVGGSFLIIWGIVLINRLWDEIRFDENG